MFLLSHRKCVIQDNVKRKFSLFSQVIKHQGGFTVIELVLALFILGLVLAGAYSFFIFSWSSFDRGSSRAVVQNNLRMAAEEITKEVRYAESIEIIDSEAIPGSAENDDVYIFLNNNGRIERKDSSGSRIIPHELDSNVLFDLSFDESGNSDLLKFIIEEINSGMEFDTEVRILNLSVSGNSIKGESNGTAIKIRHSANL